MSERSWVLIPPGAGLFSSLSVVSLLNQVPNGGATLLIFLQKCLAVQLEPAEASIIRMD